MSTDKSNDIRELLILTTADSQATKVRAQLALEETLGEGALPVLDSFLSYAEPRVRFGAVVTIGNMLNNGKSSAKAAIPKMKEMASNDPNESVRVTTSQVLDLAAHSFGVDEARRDHP